MTRSSAAVVGSLLELLDGLGPVEREELALELMAVLLPIVAPEEDDVMSPQDDAATARLRDEILAFDRRPCRRVRRQTR